jgi:hypothetical protein
MESERLHGSTTLIQKVLITLIVQPRDHFVHELGTLGAEFICAVYGRLIDMDIKYLAQAQRRYLAWEDEIRDEKLDGVPKEYSLRTFIPPSLADSDKYWHHIAAKSFAIATQPGPSTFSLTFTMNPHWPGYQAVKRHDDVWADLAMGSIFFKTKLSTLMKFIQKKKIFGKISVFAWRIECHKHGLPHTHILSWSDFDTQDVCAVETGINARYPKDSAFPYDERMLTDFRQLLDSYQIHHHSRRC